MLILALAVCAWILVGWYGGAIVFTDLQRSAPEDARRAYDAIFLLVGMVFGPCFLPAAIIRTFVPPTAPQGRAYMPNRLLWTRAQARREIEALAVVSALAGTLCKEAP